MYINFIALLTFIDCGAGVSNCLGTGFGDTTNAQDRCSLSALGATWGVASACSSTTVCNEGGRQCWAKDAAGVFADKGASIFCLDGWYLSAFAADSVAASNDWMLMTGTVTNASDNAGMQCKGKNPHTLSP